MNDPFEVVDALANMKIHLIHESIKLVACQLTNLSTAYNSFWGERTPKKKKAMIIAVGLFSRMAQTIVKVSLFHHSRDMIYGLS